MNNKFIITMIYSLKIVQKLYVNYQCPMQKFSW